ncbi:MAG: hypothetical protein QGG25_10680 [Phycisphaerae bacterium]|nr:hypothetical protein [Phycisphaerae bacterium]
MLLLVIGGACAGLACWRGCPRQAATNVLATTAPAPDEDARQRKLVVGTWGDEYKGKRTMTLLADGTGTMHVELSGFNAILGSKMRFDMVWSLEGGRLKKKTIGGEPSGRVNMILKMMGDSVDEPILELTEDRMLLLDADGETKYDWRRAGSGGTQSK